MNLRTKLPGLILFTIIAVGGFGIVRMIVVRDNAIGLSAIVVSLVLAGIYKHLATSRQPTVRNVMGTAQSKWPLQLASAASDSFEIFPGRPEGYAGYTDYTAMSVDVNDDLLERQPVEQYALLGFGNGFLEGLRKRLGDGENHRRIIFHVDGASERQRELIGWLAYLHRSGTDNAGPSTENLHSVIGSVSKDIGSKGPITMKFWDKVQSKKSERLNGSCTSSKTLKEWTEVYQAAFVDGQRLALGATVVNKSL
jgi:hypothetical protein